MPSTAIVDSSALIATIDESDHAHSSCVQVFLRGDLRFVVPMLVVAEVCHIVERFVGTGAEAVFLRSLEQFEIQAPLPQEWQRIADLVERYADFPLGGVDASIVALTERLNTDLVITLDRRHFTAVRPRHVDALRLLPD